MPTTRYWTFLKYVSVCIFMLLLLAHASGWRAHITELVLPALLTLALWKPHPAGWLFLQAFWVVTVLETAIRTVIVVAEDGLSRLMYRGPSGGHLATFDVLFAFLLLLTIVCSVSFVYFWKRKNLFVSKDIPHFWMKAGAAVVLVALLSNLPWVERTIDTSVKSNTMELYATALSNLGVDRPSVTTSGSFKGTHYPIMDSGVWATKSHPGDVYWLDNDHVLFLGSENFKPVPRGEEDLSIWEIGKGVTIYKRNVDAVCYQDGVILYAQIESMRQLTYFRGKFGQEQRYEVPAEAQIDKMNCRYGMNLPGRENGRASRLLLEKDGYIDDGPILGKESLENTQLVLYKPGAKEGITLPFGRREVENLRYYSFKQAYFLYGWFYDKATRAVRSPWPKGLSHPVWWLASDGTVTEMKVPPGVWDSGGGLAFYPTLKGILIVFDSGVKSAKDPGNQGGYFLQDNEVQKVIHGYLWGAGVSPDGCKVAFSHAPYEDADRADDRNRRTLKMIDFCEKGVKP